MSIHRPAPALQRVEVGGTAHVPGDRGERQKKMVGIGMVATLVAAGFIDLWARLVPLPSTYAFGVVYVLAFAGGIYAVLASRRIADTTPSEPVLGSVLERVREPLRHDNYRRLLGFLASWNFAINFAAPFMTDALHRLSMVSEEGQVDDAGPRP